MAAPAVLSQAHGSIVLVGGPVTFDGPGTQLIAANIPGMVTQEGTPLFQFSNPVPGRLQYTGTETLTFNVRAELSTRSTGSTPSENTYALGVNGSFRSPAYLAKITQWNFLGSQHLSLQQNMVLVTGASISVLLLRTILAPIEINSMAILVEPVADTIAAEAQAGATGLEWTGQEADLNLGLLDSDLAETVVYNGTSTRCVFDPQPVEIDNDTGAMVISIYPLLSTRVSDLAALPAKGDTVDARGISYIVTEISKMGYDWVDLKLTRDA